MQSSRRQIVGSSRPEPTEHAFGAQAHPDEPAPGDLATAPSSSSPIARESEPQPGAADFVETVGTRAVKLAVVVQRTARGQRRGRNARARDRRTPGASRAGGGVNFTCASDYVTWRNELPGGEERINNVPVRRVRVKHERDPLTFGRLVRAGVQRAALDSRRTGLARGRRSGRARG